MLLQLGWMVSIFTFPNCWQLGDESAKGFIIQKGTLGLLTHGSYTGYTMLWCSLPHEHNRLQKCVGTVMGVQSMQNEMGWGEGRNEREKMVKLCPILIFKIERNLIQLDPKIVFHFKSLWFPFLCLCTYFTVTVAIWWVVQSLQYLKKKKKRGENNHHQLFHLIGPCATVMELHFWGALFLLVYSITIISRNCCMC